MQHHPGGPVPPSLRIRDEADERPATRRKIVAVCVLVAIAIHGALALAPINFGGSPAEYGIATGNRIEVTLLFESDEPTAAATEQAAAAEPPPPPIAFEPAADMQPTTIDEPIAAAPEVAPAARPMQPQRQAVAAAASSPKPAARSAGVGQRTIAKPDYLRNPPPKYPAESRKLREQGVVLLKVSVTSEGRAGDVQLQRSSGFARLDQAALNAVRHWEFSPARVGLTAVASAVEVPVRFGLN